MPEWCETIDGGGGGMRCRGGSMDDSGRDSGFGAMGSFMAGSVAAATAARRRRRLKRSLGSGFWMIHWLKRDFLVDGFGAFTGRPESIVDNRDGLAKKFEGLLQEENFVPGDKADDAYSQEDEANDAHQDEEVQPFRAALVLSRVSPNFSQRWSVGAFFSNLGEHFFGFRDFFS